MVSIRDLDLDLPCNLCVICISKSYIDRTEELPFSFKFLTLWCLLLSSTTLFNNSFLWHYVFFVYRFFFLSPIDYRVGSSDGWSALYNFNATRNGTNWAPRFAIYGDLGTDNSQSLSKLKREVQSGRYDAILHVGEQIWQREIFSLLFLFSTCRFIAANTDNPIHKVWKSWRSVKKGNFQLGVCAVEI